MTENNNLKGVYVEYHIIQSFPVTCLNRDDVNSPKTAIVGGTTRARVSSQCWKRAVRMQMQELGVKLGIRSKKIHTLIEEECKNLGRDDELARKSSEKIAKILATDTLIFFSENEAKQFAKYLSDNNFNIDNKKDKTLLSEIEKVSKSCKFDGKDGLDIALFGRMVANSTDMNIEGAASFSHAISTHKIANEVDFFTALDDSNNEDETGAGHMGTSEFNSATYYRYISLNLGVLAENLGGTEDIAKAVETFTKALYLAIPTAKQNAMSGASPWDYARILVRKGQRMQASFDEAVKSSNGFSKNSIEALDKFIEEKSNQAGSLYGKLGDFSIGGKSKANVDDIIKNINDTIGNL
ncbi:MAG: type I-E CRISPR-associated protein Cas7/Cse4/CasC [Deferribacterales bacterium]|nr:type I-E CRISPR-associated protein Cas7/Cse4/CasC [Deferribacterales bacterium]